MRTLVGDGKGAAGGMWIETMERTPDSTTISKKLNELKTPKECIIKGKSLFLCHMDLSVHGQLQRIIIQRRVWYGD